MKNIFSLLILFMCLFVQAQNDAYFISQGGFDIVRVDMDSPKIKTCYTFKDSILEAEPRQEIEFNFLIGSSFISKDRIWESIPHESIKDWVFSLKDPYPLFIKDSFNLEGNRYIMEIIYTDNQFVGGSPNRVTTNIRIENLGIIYSSSNWIDAHTNIMICHQDSLKQKILIQAYKQIFANFPEFIQSSRLKKIINMTQKYKFNNLVDELSKNWLAAKNDFKIIDVHSEVNNRLVYTVVIKNVSKKPYYFLSNSLFGPSYVEHTINDKRVTEKINGDYHGTQHHYNFHKTNENTYLAPGEEKTFSLEPNLHQRCGACADYVYSGFQVYRYGIDFFYWLFADEVEHENKFYTLYHLNEIE